MKRINPNSSIRSGYKFEDLFVLKLCIDWLMFPEKYQKILVQYIPDEIQERGFSIDDIVAVTKNNEYVFHQLKYKQNPTTDLWTFNHLIEKGLLKWVRSLDMASKLKVAGSLFITNGAPDKEVKKCYFKGKIDLDKVKSFYPTIYKRLENLENISLLRNFFSNFSFEFNYPDKYTLEIELRTLLYRELRVVKSGVDNLLLFIANLGSEKEPKELTLAEIRSYLAWDNPRPLNQNFEVPTDFEFFDKHTHDGIITDLTSPIGGIKVIIGKPGTGKSTYLSKLFLTIQGKLNITAIRHHYHLNPKDSSFRDRLNADRVSEALRAEFKMLKDEVIEELAYENTAHTPLKYFINKVAKFYYSKGKSFVLIVDGLDHVIREGKNVEELKEFLNEILYPQPGLWIVLGTQEMAIPLFPNIIYKYAEKNKWIEIKGLNKTAVGKIIIANKKRFEFPDNNDFVNEIITEIFKKTNGNPLHLRYILNQLKISSNRINTYFLQAIVPYKNEIKDYYEELWRHLPSPSKTMCFAISTLDFKLQEEQLLELASYFIKSPAKLTDSFNLVKHLIRFDLAGISVYHNSFLVFLLTQPELNQQKYLLYRHIRNWLKKSGNVDLKWAELAKIEYYLGNSVPILSLTKEWVINSFLDCRDQNQIQRLLDLAVEASFSLHEYRKLIYFKLLDESYSNRYYNLYNTLQKIWVTSFVLKSNLQIVYPDFSQLSHYEIKELLLALKLKGRVYKIPDDVKERFEELLSNREYETEDILLSYIDILEGFDVKPESVYTLIIKFRGNESSGKFFKHYCSLLVRNKKLQDLNIILKSDLKDYEIKFIVQVLIRQDLENGSLKCRGTIKKLIGTRYISDLEVVYNCLNKTGLKVKIKLSKISTIPLEFEFRHHTEKAFNLYKSNFYSALHLCMDGKNEGVSRWINNTNNTWPVLMMKYLFSAAKLLAECNNERRKFDIKDVMSFFDQLPMISYKDDFEIYELSRVVRDCIVNIIEIASFINIRNKYSNYLDLEDVKLVKNCKWLYPDDVLAIWKMPLIKLSDDAFKYIKDTQVDELNTEITPFNKRAEKLANLAILAKELNKPKDALELLVKSAENIISYSNHKYMLLHRIMRSVEICGEAGSNKTRQYIRRVLKYVYNIQDLTDGDETGSFVYDLGTMMAKFDKNLLYNFYFHSLKIRNYYLSEHLFADTLSTLKMTKPIPYAIGNTAIDKNSYNTLIFLSKKDNGSRKVLQNIWDTFGKPDYSEGEKTNNYSEKTTKFRDSINYSAILPKNLAEYLENLELENFGIERYERYNYLFGWTKFWLTKRNSKIEEILNYIIGFITPQIDQVKDELLMFIYPYALKFNKNFAFECLVWAQANSSSWSEEYIRNMKYSQKIWRNVIKEYPSRIDEFFEKSILSSGKYYNLKGTGQIPLPKATQFFVDAGQLGSAETITEYYIDCLDVLFPGLDLPELDFIVDEKNISEFDILIARFEWLSPMVRERAGWHLALLLENDPKGTSHKQFFKWLNSVTLESLACNGLLVLIKSLHNNKSDSYLILKKYGVGKLLNLRCSATDLLLMNIASKLDQELKIHCPFIISINYRDIDITKEKFYKILGTYLPLIYQDYIEKFQKKTNFSIWEIWYSFYKGECENLSLNETNDDRDFKNRKRTYITGRSTIFSEVLKSTFFRLIDYLVEILVLDYEDLFFYTVKNFQMDPSIWNIRLAKKPLWWPVLKVDSKNNFLIKEIVSSVKQIILKDKVHQILHLNGQISEKNLKYDHINDGSIQVLPFAYRLNGNHLPDAAAIYSLLYENMGIYYPRFSEFQNFCCLQNELSFSQKKSSFTLGGIEFIPLIGNITFFSIWQYYRSYHGLKLLTPILADDLKLDVKGNIIRYTKENKIIAICSDYLFTVREGDNLDRIIPSGNSIAIDKNYLSEFQKKNDLSISYVLKLKLKTWEYSYSDDFTEQLFYELIF